MAGNQTPAMRGRDFLPAYELGPVISRGGQGVVCLATQVATQKPVVVKFLLGGVFALPEAQRRFEREIDILSSLIHPGIPVILDSGQANGQHYYVTDYIAGLELDLWVQVARPSIRDTLRVFEGICAAVGAAHENDVAHCDLKPTNIIIDSGHIPHVLDFGLAKIARPSPGPTPLQPSATTDRFLVGSYPWLAPEQVSNQPCVGTATDVYVLGLLLYYTLTGRLPFDMSRGPHEVLRSIREADPPKPSRFRHETSRDLDTVVLKCLAKEPGRRYANAPALARDIQNLLHGRQIEAKPEPLSYQLGQLRRSHPRAVAVTLLSSALVVSAAVAMYALWQRAEHQRHLAQVRYGRLCVEQGSPARAVDILAPEYRGYHDHASEFALRALLHGYPCRYLLPIGAQRIARYSPDGRWIVSAGDDGAVSVVEARTGRRAPRLPSESACARSVAFTPDGTLIFAGGTDGRIRSWRFDTGTGRCFEPSVQATQSLRGPVNCLAVTADGNHLAAGSDAGDVRLWRITTSDWNPEHQWQESGPITGLAFSSDGLQLAASAVPAPPAAGPGPGGVWLWSTMDGAQVGCLPEGVYRGVAFSPDDGQILVGADALSAWNPTTGEVVPLESESSWGVRALDISHGTANRCIAIASGNGLVRLYDTHRRMLRAAQAFHANEGPRDYEACFGPTAEAGLVTAGPEGLKVWDFPSAAGLDLTTHGGDRRLTALDVGPGGDQVLIVTDPLLRTGTSTAASPGGPPGQLFIWERRANRVVPVRPPAATPWQLASLAPDGRTLAAVSGSARSTDRLEGFSLDGTARWSQPLDLAGSPSALLWLEPDPPALLLGLSNGVVHLVRLSTPRAPGRIEEVRPGDNDSRAGLGACTALVTSRDRRWLAASLEGPGCPGSVCIWHATGTALVDQPFDGRYTLYSEFSTHNYTWSVAFVEGKRGVPVLATAGSSHAIHLWDIQSGAPTGQLAGHEGVIRQVFALHDGLLVSASDDHTVRVWDTDQREELCVLHRSHSHTPVLGACDGQVVIADDSFVTVVDVQNTPEFMKRILAGTEPPGPD